MTLFNYVTDPMQPTFSPVAYFDVCPDFVAIADAIRLRENPPKMIIYMEMPEPIYKLHENMFRNGQTSGQRNIDAAIQEIVKKYKYKKIDTFISPAGNGLLWYGSSHNTHEEKCLSQKEIARFAEKQK